MTIVIGASVSAAGSELSRYAHGALYLFLLAGKRIRRKEPIDALLNQVRHRPAC
jgi:hypothetical protein